VSGNAEGVVSCVQQIFGIWWFEPVEAAGRSEGVGSHVQKVKPVANFEFGEVDILADDVDAIASGPEERTALSVFVFLHRNRLRERVVKHNIVEGSIESVGEIVEDFFGRFFLVLRVGFRFHPTLSTRDNTDGQSVTRSAKESTGLGYNANFWWEMLVQNRSKISCNVHKRETAGINSWPASSKIKKGEFESGFFSQIENSFCKEDGINKRGRRETTTSNMKADANKVEAQHTTLVNQLFTVGKRGAKLGSEGHDRFTVIGENSENKFGRRMDIMDFLQFRQTIKSHEIDFFFLGESDVFGSFAGIGKDDIFGGSANAQSIGDFLLLAQSKPAPKACNVRIMLISGLDFIA